MNAKRSTRLLLFSHADAFMLQNEVSSRRSKGDITPSGKKRGTRPVTDLGGMGGGRNRPPSSLTGMNRPKVTKR